MQADGSGYFALPLLSIGTYTVRVTQPGFQAFELKNASLEGQQNLQLDIKLQAASVTATVNVQAEETNTSSAPTPLWARRFRRSRWPICRLTAATLRSSRC